MKTRTAPWKRKPKVVGRPNFVLLAIPAKGQMEERLEIGRKAFCDVFPELKAFKVGGKLHALFTKGRDLGLYKDWYTGPPEEVGGIKLYKINLKY